MVVLPQTVHVNGTRPFACIQSYEQKRRFPWYEAGRVNCLRQVSQTKAFGNRVACRHANEQYVYLPALLTDTRNERPQPGHILSTWFVPNSRSAAYLQSREQYFRCHG
jgi:hypothetical protein